MNLCCHKQSSKGAECSDKNLGEAELIRLREEADEDGRAGYRMHNFVKTKVNIIKINRASQGQTKNPK